VMGSEAVLFICGGRRSNLIVIRPSGHNRPKPDFRTNHTGLIQEKHDEVV
jgi:phage gp45-like